MAVKIIAFEGTDFSGKSTISKKVYNQIKKNNEVRMNTGTLVNTFFSKMICEFANQGNDFQKEISYTLAYLCDHFYVNVGSEMIIQDRYWPSVIAYGNLLNKEKSIHSRFNIQPLFVQPDALIYLTTSYEEAYERSVLRNDKSKLDEKLGKDEKLFCKLQKEYESIISQMNNVFRCDTSGKKEKDIGEEVLSFLYQGGLLCEL